MSRAHVMSFSWPNALIEQFRRIVPPEARSAFVHRAVRREMYQPDASFSELDWRQVDTIEAYVRGWLLGVFFGASQDPRKEFDADNAQAFITENAWKNKVDEEIPPVEVGGRLLVRRPRDAASWESTPGSSAVSVRWPATMVELFPGSGSDNRSAVTASAVRRELSLVNHTAAKVVVTESTATTFCFGLDDGIEHGACLRPSKTLDRAHVEGLVAREIAAYLLEPVLGRGRRRRNRSRRSPGR